MIAKVIAHGRDRAEALARLHRALSQMTVRRARRHDEQVVPARPARPARGAGRRHRHVVARPAHGGRRAPPDPARRRRARRRRARRRRPAWPGSTGPRSSAGPAAAGPQADVADRPRRSSCATAASRTGPSVRQRRPGRARGRARRRRRRRRRRAPRSRPQPADDRRPHVLASCRRCRAATTSSRSTASPTASPATTPASCGRRRRRSSSASTSRPATSSRPATGSASSRR